MDDLRWRELVEKTKKGDKQAFEVLYRETQRSVYFTALKILKNEDNALDVMQDSFMTAIRKLGELDDGAKFPKWINRIAVNNCLMRLRKVTEESLDEKSEMGFDPKDDESFIPEEYVTDAAKRKVIMDIIQNVLSDVQRQAVIMFYYDEMSLEEIAAAMDCPAKTVSSRLCSAREKIREAVLIYERKQGDRLHAIVPVPILTLILRKEAEVLSVPDIPLEIFSALLSDAAASASASTVSSTVIAGGSTKMGGFLTGKVIAAIAAGVIAVGGVTTAVVLSKGDKDGKSDTSSSVSAAANSKGGSDSDDNKGSSDSSENSISVPGSDVGELKGSVYQYGANYLVLPPRYKKTSGPNESTLFEDSGAGSNAFYCPIQAAKLLSDSYKNMTPAEIKEYFRKNADSMDMLYCVYSSVIIKDVVVDSSETITIDGQEMIKEVGVFKADNIKSQFDIPFAAIYGKLNFGSNSNKDYAPAAIWTYTLNTDPAVKAELSKTIDIVISGIGKTEAEAQALADKAADDHRVMIRETPSTTAPNGTQGTVKESNSLKVLLPYTWYINGTQFGMKYSDIYTRNTLTMNSFDHRYGIHIAFTDENNYKNRKSTIVERVKKDPEGNLKDLSEFTYGDFTFTGITYKAENIVGEPYVDMCYIFGQSKSKPDHHIEVNLFNFKYDDKTVQDVLGTLQIAK